MSTSKKSPELDPEAARAQTLLTQVENGSATDAEREELALYQEQPAVLATAQQAVRDAALSEGWLDRLEGDRALAAVEKSRFTRVERGLGAGMFVVGFAASFVAPVVGAGLMAAGAAALAVSFLRTKLLTLGKDPYRDVER